VHFIAGISYSRIWRSILSRNFARIRGMLICMTRSTLVLGGSRILLMLFVPRTARYRYEEVSFYGFLFENRDHFELRRR